MQFIKLICVRFIDWVLEKKCVINREKLILWLVDPLLGNDLEISNYTTAVIMQRRKRQQRIGVFCAVRAKVL
jgi:hypothetical protein